MSGETVGPAMLVSVHKDGPSRTQAQRYARALVHIAKRKKGEGNDLGRQSDLSGRSCVVSDLLSLHPSRL